MNAITRSMSKTSQTIFRAVCVLELACLTGMTSQSGYAQEMPDRTSVNSSIENDGTGTIIVEAHGQLPKKPVFFTASSVATVQVSPERVDQNVQLTIKVIQGNARTLSFGLNGEGQVEEVQDSNLRSWSVRKEGGRRFLDLHLKEKVTELKPVIKIGSPELKLPTSIDLTHLTPGDSVGFDSTVNINYTPGVDGAAQNATGFMPLDMDDRAMHFRTATGGRIRLLLNRSGASPAPVELIDTALNGKLHSNHRSIQFQLRTTARVTESNAEIAILSGNAAVSEMPTDDNYGLRLSTGGDRPEYRLVFPKTGTFTVTLNFVAAVSELEGHGHGVDFTIAAGAVVPLTLTGLDANLEFHRDQESVVPLHNDNAWMGFLPATGRARLEWKSALKAGGGKLFFTTTGRIETNVGAGLLRQDHRIDIKVLQGELKSLTMLLHGPGEILDVQGGNIIAWKVSGEGETRQLDVTLSQPIADASQISVRSQTPLGPFPVRVKGLRLHPVGAIRHSGYLRLSNLGSVRLQPTGLSGLSQLEPAQFPGDPIKERQVFVYRFPAADYAFAIAADRIQPEVSVSELVLYQLTETDRVIKADIELDVREAPIREWSFGIPPDYSVVSVTGAGVADYIAESEVADGRRNLKVIFGQDVSGRQLVTLHLEKSQAAAEADWVLPRIEYRGAKTVRGDLGIIGAPGFRITVGETGLLVEKPLSYFPRPAANLQQAFRIRETGWSATVHIERLDQSVRSDVFHLYSLSRATVYGSALINYFVTGAPVSEWKITVPEHLGNVIVDGQDIRTWRREGDTLLVTLHQPIMGPYTLLVSFEEKPDADQSSFQPGLIAPVGVQGQRGYIQVVSATQVEISTTSISKNMLILDPLELPAEFRLLSTAPPLGTWQYTERPFELTLNVGWFEPGTTATQVVEFSEANSRVSKDGELVTDVLYYVKSRGQSALRIKLPDDPVRLWEVSVDGRTVTARKAEDATIIPLPGSTDPNIPVEVRLRLGKPAVDESTPKLTLPVVFVPVLKTQWTILGDEKQVVVPRGGTVAPTAPALRRSGFDWVAKRGLVSLLVIGLFTSLGFWTRRKKGLYRLVGPFSSAVAVVIAIATAAIAWSEIAEPAALQLSLPVISAGESVELQVESVPLWLAYPSWLGVGAFFGGVAAVLWSFALTTAWFREIILGGGMLSIAFGVLFQGDGAPFFYALLAFAIVILLFVPSAWNWIRSIRHWFQARAPRRRERRESARNGPVTGSAPATATILLLSFALASISQPCTAAIPAGFEAADSITQQWRIDHQEARLSASGTIKLSGKPGDRFLLLRTPAVLTRFEGKGLRLTKREAPGEGLTYIISIPLTGKTGAPAGNSKPVAVAADFQAMFEFQLETIKPTEGVPVLTGTASVQEINLSYDEPGWEVHCSTAVRVESVVAASETTQVKVLLGPENATLSLKPKVRDVTSEETSVFC